MSKSLNIDTAASWAATITVPTDGDTFQETQTDAYFDSIADRLGYLKATVDTAVLTSGTQTVAGDKTFTGDTTFTPGGGSVVVNGLVEVSGGIAMQSGPISLGAGAEGYYVRALTLADASVTIASNYETVRVPALTANRVYTLPAASYGLVRIRFVRMRTADAFTATLQDPSGPTTLGVISASNAGWIEVESDGSSWKVVGWGGTVASLSTTA